MDKLNSNNNTLTSNEALKKKSYNINKNVPIHHAINIGAVFVVAKELGLDLDIISASLEKYKVVKGRGEEFVINLKGKNIKIIDDSYNANPASMQAALEHLSSLAGKRKIAIISDMRELGESEIRMHEDMAKCINSLNIDLVITMGSLSKHIFNKLEKTKCLAHYEDKDSLENELENLIEEGDILMFKGSKSTLMHEVVASLLSGKEK